MENRVPVRLLDNQWHTIEFQYQLGNVNLIIDKELSTILGTTRNFAINEELFFVLQNCICFSRSKCHVQHDLDNRPRDQEQCSDFNFGQKLLGMPVPWAWL